MTIRSMRGTTALVCLSLATPLAAQDDTTLTLDDEAFLGTIVLTPGRRDLSFGSPVSRTVIDEEEIADRQAGTVGQLVDSVPSVQLINGTSPQGSGVQIRGFGANTTFGSDQKIAIQIDGASVGSEEIYRVGTQLFTDPQLYREVEVLRGTIGSFAYGAGIVGGVIRLETKDPEDFTNGQPGVAGRQVLELSDNGEGLTSSTTLAWQATDRIGLLANYTHRTQDELEDGDGDTIPNSDFDAPSLLLKATGVLGDDFEHEVALSYTQTTTDENDVPYDQFAGLPFGNVDRTTETRQVALDYRYDPVSDLVDLRATLSYADQEITSAPVAGFNPLLDADQRYETTKLTISNRAALATGPLAHDLLIGAERLRKERADATSAPGGRDDRYALFLVDEMSFGGFSVTPALRYENSTIRSATGLGTFDDAALMGGLALGYDFGNGFAVFASAAQTAGLPIIDDLGDPTRINTAEQGRTYELGAEYAADGAILTGDRLAIRGNLYTTELSDITSYTVPGSTTQTLDRVEINGLELEASYGLANGVYTDLAFAMASGRETDPGGASREWRNLPADRLQVTLGRRFGEGEQYDLGWEVVHTADRRDSNGAELPDETIHNLRGTWRPEGGRLAGTEFRLGVENLFDEFYVGHLASPSRPAPGRTVKLTASVAF
ncbi:TonB-dependent receptor domain-containing protein [Roseobacter sp. HKCCA0434]|uniref:TonB-dependent receptor domain-containing protein n=1 Tax=Roseobacter sp. HKCCA0434 TaxID=3079297 RepID=UPI00290592B1|nr:TonB-dependent receptor [Roseobacter sp. HKCCA0434]